MQFIRRTEGRKKQIFDNGPGIEYLRYTPAKMNKILGDKTNFLLKHNKVHLKDSIWNNFI